MPVDSTRAATWIPHAIFYEGTVDQVQLVIAPNNFIKFNIFTFHFRISSSSSTSFFPKKTFASLPLKSLFPIEEIS